VSPVPKLNRGIGTAMPGWYGRGMRHFTKPIKLLDLLTTPAVEEGLVALRNCGEAPEFGASEDFTFSAGMDVAMR
jgi:hypothetical protein